jgi:phage recombination protein Bet
MSVLKVTEGQEFWTDQQLAVLRTLGLEQATKADLALFLSYAQRTGLDPFSRQLYMIGRWDGRAQAMRFTIQASIDGLRVVAARSGEYAGQTAPEWCGPDGKWVDVWLDVVPPAAAKVGVYRHGFAEPLVSVARYDSYCPMKDGKPTGLWKSMPDVMLSKVAEALALRKAFPNDLSGIYSDEEMDQADARHARPALPAASEAPAALPAPEPSDEERSALRDLATAHLERLCGLTGHTVESLREEWVMATNDATLDVEPWNGEETLRQVITGLVQEIREAEAHEAAEAALGDAGVSVEEIVGEES